jgi:sugar lactone lactonase YvrE
MKVLTGLGCGIAALGVALTSGCGYNNAKVASESTSPKDHGAATSLYVVQATPAGGSILQFEAASNGNAPPMSKLTPPADVDLISTATDSSGNIYMGVGTKDGSFILVYPAGATGSPKPSRAILLDPTNASRPNMMTVDSNGSLYVSDESSCKCISVFADSADGEAPVMRQIQGNRTLIVNPIAIAVDSSGYVYVADFSGHGVSGQDGQINIFSPGSTGNVAPARVLVGTAATPLLVSGMAVDWNGDIFVNQGVKVVEFAAGAANSASPMKTIILPVAQNDSSALRVDGLGDLFVLGDQNDATKTPYIAMYSSTASGSAVAQSTFTSTSWTITGSGFGLK